MRKPIVAGNWKMNKTTREAGSLAESIKIDLGEFIKGDVVLCPPFTALKTVSDVISGSAIRLGGQHMSAEPAGAFTGEISAGMLRDLYCNYVILGHSERRAYSGETDAGVNEKTLAAHASGLKPIVCVGEKLEEREAGITQAVVEAQVKGCLAGLDEEQMKNTIVAYEPVWAIGTGKTATPEMAQEVHAHIRAVVAGMFGDDLAKTVRIQYGGSMKPGNAAELISQPDIDGGLIGGAALDAGSFVEIVKAAV